MALAVGGMPDWTTFEVAGPKEMAGAQDHARFQWTASVAVHGALTCDALPGPQALAATSTVEDATVPFRCVGAPPRTGQFRAGTASSRPQT
jgi:hypothetical protein